MKQMKPKDLKIGDNNELLSEDAVIYSYEEGKAEESPKYVKNIIKKLKELDEHNRHVWLNRIMDEFKDEIRTKAYSEGFKQGKFEGALEREKVKIPKFVAEWLEEYYDAQPSLFLLVSDMFEMDFADLDVCKWANDNQEKFLKAILIGYEVEKDPLYWVRNNEGKSLLVRHSKGIVQTSAGHNIHCQETYKDRYTFTEKEIKDYDERYWAFAVPVEEE